MKLVIVDDKLESFIASLEKPTQAKVIHKIDLIEDYGHKLGMPHVKKIKSSLYELRIRGQQEVRIFFTFHQSQIVLLHGFVKKSQEIPPREIKMAKQKLKTL